MPVVMATLPFMISFSRARLSQQSPWSRCTSANGWPTACRRACSSRGSTPATQGGMQLQFHASGPPCQRSLQGGMHLQVQASQRSTQGGNADPSSGQRLALAALEHAGDNAASTSREAMDCPCSPVMVDLQDSEVEEAWPLGDKRWLPEDTAAVYIVLL